MALGGVGMYGAAVALPAIQAEFGVTRSQASLPYTVTMIGFGFGGILMGRLADRYGVMIPVLIGIAALGLGFIAAGLAPSLLTFAIAQCLLIGALGNAATFVPLVADASMWFTRRRGIAMRSARANYLARPLAAVLQLL
jgi:MFS family permease